MAKLVPTVALINFLLLVLLTKSSSAYTTIVTTIEIDDPTGSQSCRQEAQKQDLINCWHFVHLFSRVAEPELMRRCCNELQEKVRDGCQCDAFKYVVEKELQTVAGKKKESESMKQRARRFPSRCGIQQCEISFGIF
ncbi:hypothetical protein M5689_011994 [Euphorbia peplus]|nr:hypothetical protein M5689_011994 [Euphorbia peplus]